MGGVAAFGSDAGGRSHTSGGHGDRRRRRSAAGVPSLKKDGVKVDYAAKCYMPDTECEHLVLDTSDGKVSVILVPDYPLGARAFVADRRMTALVSPAGSGGYIVVARSPKAAKRAERLFVRG
jgi:hypothetical protein